jgi:hypothetical protein
MVRFLRYSAAIVLGLILSPGVLGRGLEAQPSTPGISETEHIFVCCIYGHDPRGAAAFTDSLRRIGASWDGILWYYTNAPQRKAYVIHIVEDAAGMTQALYTEKAHVIVDGHSNFGLGGVFASADELRQQTITNIQYMDDDRLLDYGGAWTAVNVPKLLSGQAYPNWWPVFKDGTSAIMPYDFDDPRGAPPYNSYLTYQLPGDPVHYKIESVPNGALERFPGCGRPAWYAPDGSAPDPKNLDHRKYFITNTNTAFESIGKWLVCACPEGCCGTNYLSTPAGTGLKEARWHFSVPSPGTYNVMARWPASTQNVSSATYSIAHARGTTRVQVNQRTNGGGWNELGAFTFGAEEYQVTLTDKTGEGAGNVVADAVRISGTTNTGAFDLTIDNTFCPKIHYARKTIVFRRQPGIDPTKLRYARMFYDGCLSGLYYLDVFHHGVVFYTVGDAYLSEFETYLRAYLQGASDAQIWAALQDLQTVYDYYDFSRSPKEQNTSQAESPAVISQAPPKLGALAHRWARSPPDRVLETLKRPDFIHNERLSRTIIMAAFQRRQAAAIAVALHQIALPLIEKTDEMRLSKIRGLIAARRILEAFPEQAMVPLLEAYEKGDLPTKGNIIRASAKISGGDAVKGLLLRALGDQSFCDKVEWQATGAPLRLCDVAYNQLVLHYRVNGVLRTITPSYSLEARDYHIGVLKAKL